MIDNECLNLDKGMHVKHRLTKYHDFFCNKLKKNEIVLDIGCGNGFLDYDMATRVGAKIIGIELSKQNYNIAVKRYPHKNIEYVLGDALAYLPSTKIDTIVMSNVLEHLENRVDFLKKVQKQINPKRWLIRVPMINRDWQTALMKDLGIDYRLDPTHYIEYTEESFRREIKKAGLRVNEIKINWGEIWSEVESV
jgi:2-polyprenyl-3-methyl-5-hydroxy-6-metoxy-1,4-benzoquinol methylase